MKKIVYIFLAIVFILSGIAIFLQIKQKITPRKEVKLVEEFPQIPVFPASILLDSKKSDSEEGFVYEATWQTNEAVPAIETWYEKELQKAGWKIETTPADYENESIQLLVVEKDQFLLNISIIRDPSISKTNVIAQFAKKPPVDVENEESE